MSDDNGNGGMFGRKGGRVKNPLAEVAQLRERVAQLERDVQETRELNRRLAEITDVVAEVLLPAEQRDDARLREILSRYDKTL
jgi:hypothetical protein